MIMTLAMKRMTMLMMTMLVMMILVMNQRGGWLMMMIVMTIKMFVGQLADTKTKAIVTNA